MNYSELNHGQLQAVTSDHNRILTLAGAGTGKTKTLVTRVARLIEEGVDPCNILMLTFTRAAAMEQKERLINLVGEEGEDVFAGTFHSFAVKTIRQYAERVGCRSNFSIYDDEDTYSVITTIIDELQYTIKPQDVVEAMEKKAVHCVPLPMGDITHIVKEYEFRCVQNNAIDFNHLMQYLWIIASDKNIQYLLQKQYQYVFVDEFQDTDKQQMNILELINPDNLFLVGDDWQSIYGFRGSDVSIIMGLAESEEYEVIKLENNYRSTEEIVKPANSLISHNNQTEKTLIAHRNGPEIELKEYMEPDEEYKGIVDKIRELRDQRVPYGEIAILARTNKQVAAIADALAEEELPYQIKTRSNDILNRYDIKRLFDWMAAAINPMNDEAVKRIMNWPRETIGRLDMQKIEMLKLEKDCSLLTAADMSEPAKSFCSTYYNISLRARNSLLPAHNIFDIIVEFTGIKELHKETGLSNRDNNIDAVRDIMIDWETQMEAAGEGYYAEDWIEWYNMRNISTEAMADKKEDAIQLMTAHGSKGLEFEAVIISHCNEKQFPLGKGDIEEERRLFYVGLTRAKKYLTLTRAMRRYLWNGGQLEDTVISRFIEESTGN